MTWAAIALDAMRRASWADELASLASHPDHYDEENYLLCKRESNAWQRRARIARLYSQSS